MNWIDLLVNYALSHQPNYDSKHFHSVINEKKHLVLCLGDSWTFGGGLDAKDRLDQIYGKLIADHYNADLINIGCPGYSNSWILLLGQFLAPLLKKTSYEKIYIIITLTENGRDILTPSGFQFNYIEFFQKNSMAEDSYYKLLVEVQKNWIRLISNIKSESDHRTTLFVGQNFVWHELYNEIANTESIITDKNWIELLADYQNLERPIRTNLVCGFVFDTLTNINKIARISNQEVFKNFCLPYIEKAMLVNQWLDSSKLNSKKGSKHPTALGHRLWADHIINSINSNESTTKSTS